ncbi:YciI family protein [Devosia lacusdianchii]|jgi:hypothetical protein|uniref:YciI family protein n=1 Tax=Devosia lacusdianchii TaxID=2917991 RepID=UPI001F06B3B2|nr:YciI family protein [Devosia sp. JXJ CY 41]
MRYLCLVCFDNTLIDTLPPGEWAQLVRESQEYDLELQRSGHFIAAEALKSPDTATTVRMRQGRMSATDGPFVELKEQVAGFILIEAADLNEAMRIGANIPLAKIGCVEVRPVL